MRQVLRARGGELQRLSGTDWIAWGALAATVTIWASFLVVTRAAMTTRLGVAEVGLMRYGIGAALFLPALLRGALLPRDARLLDVILIPLFGGLLFIVFLGSGLSIAPVADSGVFTPAMLPLYVAILSAAFMGERFTASQLAGFALIVTGALAVGGWTALTAGTPGVWKGHLLFSLASISWAIYTLLFRRSGLSPLQGGAMLCFWAALMFIPVALWQGVNFADVPARTLAIQLLFQGVLSGWVATYTFFFAISRLGTTRAAVAAALVPVLAALGGWIFLAEPIGPLKAAGIVVVAAGVALASGAGTLVERIRKDRPDHR